MTSTFAPDYRTDRNFFLLMITIMWAAILSGFGYDMVQKYEQGTLHYPLIVHLHAIAFVSWLVLITTQIILIRTKRVSVHMMLGKIAFAWVPLMVVLGCMATIIFSQYRCSPFIRKPTPPIRESRCLLSGQQPN